VSPFEAEVANKTGHDWDKETQVGLRFLEVLARWKLAGGGSETRDSFTPFGEGRGAARTAKQLIDVLDHTSAREDFVKVGVDAATIAALSMPVLLIYGEYSRCLPTLRALEKLLPQAERELIAEGGHFFPQSHGRVTLARIERFLGSSSRVAAASTAPADPIG
jgi:pimeloyl-ACP methyl ester carboxylesterase